MELPTDVVDVGGEVVVEAADVETLCVVGGEGHVTLRISLRFMKVSSLLETDKALRLSVPASDGGPS